MYGNGLDAEFVAGSLDAQRDFAAIRYNELYLTVAYSGRRGLELLGGAAQVIKFCANDLYPITKSGWPNSTGLTVFDLARKPR